MDFLKKFSYKFQINLSLKAIIIWLIYNLANHPYKSQAVAMNSAEINCRKYKDNLEYHV